MQQWRYHLGVHKTATTHIQEVLKSQRLRAKGIRYVPLDELRPATYDILESTRLPRVKFGLLRLGSRRATILSEENFLGYPVEACSFPLYPRAEHRLSIVARRKSVAFLAIRNPADFAASVFSEALRFKNEGISLESVRRSFLENGSPWLNLVRRVRGVFPNLRVWRYEDYRDNADFFISLVAGIPVVVPNIPDPEGTQRLPAETIEEIERLRATGEEVPLAGDIAPPEKPTRFEMFSAAERERLNQSYDQQVEWMAEEGIMIFPPA